MLKSCKADGYRCSSRQVVVLLSFVDETFRLPARREGEDDFLLSRTSIASDLVDDPSNLYVRWSMVFDSLRGNAFLRGLFRRTVVSSLHFPRERNFSSEREIEMQRICTWVNDLHLSSWRHVFRKVYKICYREATSSLSISHGNEISRPAEPTEHCTRTKMEREG